MQDRLAAGGVDIRLVVKVDDFSQRSDSVSLNLVIDRGCLGGGQGTGASGEDLGAETGQTI